MQQIGLYVHRLRILEDFDRIELGSQAGQFDLAEFVHNFTAHHTNEFIEGGERRSKLADVLESDEFISGVIRYGTTGIASDIVSSETDEILLRREREDVEYIPLYFCFYTPDGEDTWYIVTQSFGGRSCSSSFNLAFRDFVSNQINQSVMIQKVMPIDGIDVAGQAVQKLTLVRRHVNSSEFEEQIGDLARELKVSMSISVDGRGALGVFDTIRDRISGREDVAMIYDGIEFEEAQATVRIGSSYRQVGIVGPSNNAGVVDISDQVERDADEIPVFASIDEISKTNLRRLLDRVS